MLGFHGYEGSCLAGFWSLGVQGFEFGEFGEFGEGNADGRTGLALVFASLGRFAAWGLVAS